MASDVRRKKRRSTCRTTLRCVPAHVRCKRCGEFCCQNYVNTAGDFFRASDLPHCRLVPAKSPNRHGESGKEKYAREGFLFQANCDVLDRNGIASSGQLRQSPCPEF